MRMVCSDCWSARILPKREECRAELSLKPLFNTLCVYKKKWLNDAVGKERRGCDHIVGTAARRTTVEHALHLLTTITIFHSFS